MVDRNWAESLPTFCLGSTSGVRRDRLQGVSASVIGPIFNREAAIAPRRLSFFAAPTIFVAVLFVLTLTSWQLLVGSQRVESLGDLAWFGQAVFQILAPLQLAVAMPFAALLVASAVAIEKDRKTLDLLLMTNLTNTELVLGKLLSGMLNVLVVLVATLPLFIIIALLGGISSSQILLVESVAFASALVAGSLGSTLALWREKTFQAIAMTLLVIVLWLATWEIIAAGAVGRQWLGLGVQDWAIIMSPWQAVQAAAQPQFASVDSDIGAMNPVHLSLAASIAIACVLNVLAIALVRVWNPSRELSVQRDDDSHSVVADETAALKGNSSNVHSAGGKVRPVWDNPILWREIRTWAYGKRILVIKLVYWAMFFVCAATLLAVASERSSANSFDAIPAASRPIAALLVVGLILLNALAVTSLTNERDSRALDLLLVTDLSPKEIVFGKLGGAFYNAKEMVLLPILLCAFLWYNQQLTTENLMFLVVGLFVMNSFAAVLGLHIGMSYANSRTAIATSIGTLLFLFLGVATCMRIMLAFSSSFQSQLGTFFGCMAGGGIGLYVALGWRNPSVAIGLASGMLPFFTFVAIVSYLVGSFGVVFLVIALTYAFATVAMLLPAISEFDVATGRTTVRED